MFFVLVKSCTRRESLLQVNFSAGLTWTSTMVLVLNFTSQGQKVQELSEV